MVAKSIHHANIQYVYIIQGLRHHKRFGCQPNVSQVWLAKL